MPDDPDAFWGDKNDRRVALIEKKYAEGLDEGEADELERLQRECYDRITAIDPRAPDVLDKVAARIGRIMGRLKAERAAKEGGR